MGQWLETLPHFVICKERKFEKNKKTMGASSHASAHGHIFVNFQLLSNDGIANGI